MSGRKFQLFEEIKKSFYHSCIFVRMSIDILSFYDRLEVDESIFFPLFVGGWYVGFDLMQ